MSLFEESVKNANTTLEYWTKVIAFLQGAEGASGEKFNQEAEVPGTGQELWWFDERAIAICNLIKSLEEIEIDSGAPVPLSYVDQLEQASQQFKDTVLEAAGSVEQAEDKGIASLNPSNWVVVVNETNANLNFASHLQNFKTHAENLLTRFYQVGSIVGSAKFDAFVEAVREVSEKSESVRKNADEVTKAKESAEGDAAATNTQKTQAEKDRSEVANLLGTAQETLTKIEEVNQSSQSELAQVADITSKANALKTQVDGYETQFQAFQKTLDERTAAFKKWSGDVEALYNGLNEKAEAIGETIERADEMLAVSTNAGLAGTFKKNLDDLDGKLEKTQKEFYRAIWFVFFTALPLSAYVITATVLAINPELVPSAESEAGFWLNLMNAVKSDGLTLSATLALFLIMVPSLWRAKFSASKYHQLFQLREHYQYKYSIAMSVEGFKIQAEGYENVLAAETFSRLLFNPGDRIDVKGSIDDHPSPLMNWAMNKFGFNAKGREQ